MMEDTRIIELFFERDQQAIQELDTKYGKVCHKLSYNIVNNRYDAEECVNDAYLGAWNTIPPTKPQSLQAYICKIVRNISLKLLYRNEAAKRKSVCEVAMQEMEAYLPAQNTVEAEIEAKELAAIIDAFLDTLSVENRIIFMRRYHNGFVGGTAIMGGPLHRTTFFVAFRHKKNARILLRAECGRFDIRRCLSSKRIRVKGCL